jgi:hypothetical protein
MTKENTKENKKERKPKRETGKKPENRKEKTEGGENGLAQCGAGECGARLGV